MFNDNFAYRPILNQLTGEVNQHGYDPFEAYARLQEIQDNQGLRPDSYLSTSITSGGHARDDSLEMRDVVSRNTQSAHMLAEQLATDGQINPEDSIEPVSVGKTPWSQYEFMQFWLAVIGGFDLPGRNISETISKIHAMTSVAVDKAGVDLELFCSKESPSVRAAEYFKMADAYAQLIKNGEIDANPIPKVVRMIDPDTSLGAQAERIFAMGVGSRVYNIQVVQVVDPANLGKANHWLARDTATLIGFGATVFDTNLGKVKLVLEEAA